MCKIVLWSRCMVSAVIFRDLEQNLGAILLPLLTLNPSTPPYMVRTQLNRPITSTTSKASIAVGKSQGHGSHSWRFSNVRVLPLTPIVLPREIHTHWAAYVFIRSISFTSSRTNVSLLHNQIFSGVGLITMVWCVAWWESGSSWMLWWTLLTS